MPHFIDEKIFIGVHKFFRENLYEKERKRSLFYYNKLWTGRKKMTGINIRNECPRSSHLLRRPQWLDVDAGTKTNTDPGQWLPWSRSNSGPHWRKGFSHLLRPRTSVSIPLQVLNIQGRIKGLNLKSSQLKKKKRKKKRYFSTFVSIMLFSKC